MPKKFLSWIFPTIGDYHQHGRQRRCIVFNYGSNTEKTIKKTKKPKKFHTQTQFPAATKIVQPLEHSPQISHLPEDLKINEKKK